MRRTIALLALLHHVQSFAPHYTRSLDSTLNCQILGMNCASATQFAWNWWPDFCQRGGATDVHADGWGLAYYLQQGLREFHDTEAASTSALAQFLGQQRPITTTTMLAHIRYATTGSADNLANVHPFSREMWAMNWCFCHNGQVPLLEDHPGTWLGPIQDESRQVRSYYPVGDTDSEATFCAILNALKAQFPDTMPSLPVLHKSLQEMCQQIVDYSPERTILNFLLSCGPHVLWVYSWPGKRPGSEVWNGLHYTMLNESMCIGDDDYSVQVLRPTDEAEEGELLVNGAAETINGRQVLEQMQEDNICIVATKPLTNSKDWIELQAGELVLMDKGRPHVSPKELFRVEMEGHGLDNDGKVLRPARLEEDLRLYEFDQEFFSGGGI